MWHQRSSDCKKHLTRNFMNNSAKCKHYNHYDSPCFMTKMAAIWWSISLTAQLTEWPKNGVVSLKYAGNAAVVKRTVYFQQKDHLLYGRLYGDYIFWVDCFIWKRYFDYESYPDKFFVSTEGPYNFRPFSFRSRPSNFKLWSFMPRTSFFRLCNRTLVLNLWLSD